ncbi:MAG: NACHT domain-containing protein [Nocardiopsaceae bacterium]|nr:NACHT domain-containing protein [Nocardiopsaceae bacterium]
MTVEGVAAALGVGKSVAKIAASRWLTGRAARAAASAELIDLIKTGFPDEIVRRRTENQFEALAISVAERLRPYIRHELRGLDDGTREAALREVIRTLEAADLSDKALLADDVDPVKLARRLRASLPAREAEFQLGEAGARLYDVVLGECCDCLAHILVHLPEFTERAAAESLARLSSAVTSLQIILSRLPVRTLDAPEGDSHDDEFTRRYLTSVSDNLDRLDLLGVRFERLTRPRTTLSVAYISLNVTDEETGKNPNGDRDESTGGAAARRRDPTARRRDSVARGWDPATIGEWREERRFGSSIRVERVLSENRLMLIRGEAGSGKSTLLRWLAVTAARGGFTGDLAPLNVHVPFLVKLRSHAGQRLPRPEEFLDDVSPALGGIAPDAWAHRRLRSGRALLLIDGIDEIVESQRYDVRNWLGELIRLYPEVRVVVTSRPAATEADWLRAEGFRAAFLEPLSPADLRELVQHWHAAIGDSGDLPCPPESIPSYEAKLLARLESASHLRTLASTPLLAAMLCALNLDRDALPRDRMGLYAAAIDMLLEIRDAKRGIPSARVVRLERDQKVRLLRDLAWHLSTSDRVELPRSTARKLIDERLAAMPQVRATGEEALDALLQRSGIIREPVPGRIDFVHRTIQEYLTAEHAAGIGDMDLLIRNAGLDQWRETIVMAAGHANEPQCRELLDGILQRARHLHRAERLHGAERSRAVVARDLELVAVACLETITSIPDDVRTALYRCLDGLIPPGDQDEAVQLAAIGEPVLRRLPTSLEGLREDEAVATVRTAWLINGPGALDVLRGYAADMRYNVQYEFNKAWDYFDPGEYAERVLSATSPGGSLIVNSGRSSAAPAQFAALAAVAPLSSLVVDLPRQTDLDVLTAHANSLGDLSLTYREPTRDLATLPELARLRSLEIHAPGLTDLGFLHSLPPLTDLVITDCADIEDYSPLGRSTGLKSLHLRRCNQLCGLDQLPPLGEVISLSLGGSRLGRGALAALVSAAPKVCTLVLDDCDWVDDLAPLTALPDLGVLSICRTTPGTGLLPLAQHEHITVRVAPGQDVRGADALGNRLLIVPT